MDYFVKTNKGIRCMLCRHYCNLAEEQTGICGVNKNENGLLKNLVYGKAAALNIDPIEKKPLFHFLPGSTALSFGTVGCNLQCPFCQNWEISQTNNTISSQQVTPKKLVQLALEKHCQTIAYTYNEPTVFYPFARDVALVAKQHSIKNIFVSNGMESPELIEDMVGIIDAFNIDLKNFNHDYYKKILKGDLEGVLDTLKRIKKNNIFLEVTTLVIPNENDNEKELSAIAEFIANELGKETPWHISAFYPQYKMTYKNHTPSEALQKAYDIGKKSGLKYIYKGNVAERAITYCHNCHRELIVRSGFLITKKILNNDRCPYCNSKIDGLWN